MNDHSERFDVAVAGGGILGMSLAGFLAADGVRVCVIDDGMGGGSNANAGSLHVQLQSRFSRKHPEKLPALERNLHLYPKAVAFWKKFQSDLGADFDVRVLGGLMVAETPEQLDFLKRKSEREARLGLDVRMLDRGEVETMAPYLGPTVLGAELCAQEGKVNPLLANAAIRKWVTGLGVVLVTNTAVGTVEKAGSGYELVTATRRVRAEKVVLAAGGGNKTLAQSLNLALPVENDPLHMNITEPARPIIGHLVQHAARPITLKQFATGHVAIGGGWPARLRARDGYPTVDLASMVGNTALAQHIIPELAPLCVIRTWAGINSTADGRPILGAFSARPGVYAAVSGDAGFTLGPFCARLLADDILGNLPTEDMQAFSPDQYAAG